MCREIHGTFNEGRQYIEDNLNDGVDEIIANCDKIYGDKLESFSFGHEPVDIFESLEDVVEERGNNPSEENGFTTPYPEFNRLFGGLLPGNIYSIISRPGEGKTTWINDMCAKSAEMNGCAALVLDTEMSTEEIIMRQSASLSGVPMHLIESGKWRMAGDDVVKKIRSVWDKIKNLKFYYYNVGGMDVDSMVNTLKRFYYSKVGRGNNMIFSFDYIKTTSESQGNKNEWQVVGEMVDKFKRCVQKEILEDGKPVIPMITSVQSNRFGITNNRNAQNIIDDESIVSLSDRITQFCSHMFILRSKTSDEIEIEGRRFGTHKFINVKSRHLGEDIAGAVEPVLIDDNLRKNFINLDFKNFNIAECGDLRDIARTMNGEVDLDEGGTTEEIPDFDQF